MVFPIPWYLRFSNPWKALFNKPVYDLIIASIVNRRVIVIVSSFDWVKIKIINDIVKRTTESNPFNGMALPKYFGAEVLSVAIVLTILKPIPNSIMTAEIPVNEIAKPRIPYSLTPKYLAISIVHTNPQTLAIICEINNQLIFLNIVRIWLIDSTIPITIFSVKYLSEKQYIVY